MKHITFFLAVSVLAVVDRSIVSAWIPATVSKTTQRSRSTMDSRPSFFFQATTTTTLYNNNPLLKSQQQQQQRAASSIKRHNNNNNKWWSSMLTSTTAACATLLLLVSSLVMEDSSAITAFADTTTTTTPTTTAISPTSVTAAAAVQQQQRQQQRFMDDSPSFFLSSAAEEEKEQKESVVEEVWRLIDKYYIDQTFNGQDWKNVKEKYVSLEAKNKNKDATKLIAEMVSTLGDKYSRVLDKDQYAAIQKFDLIGVGVTLTPNEQTKEIMVGSPPIPGSASAKAGLQVGDVVTAIDGRSTSGRTAFDIVDQVSENPNAETITFSVKKAGGGKTSEDIVLNRVFQEVKDPVRYKLSETRADGTKVGFVRILEFNALVGSKLEQALKILEEQGANAYVLDLRMNTGGAFQSAVEVSGFFLGNDKVATYVLDNTNANIPFKTLPNRILIDREDPIAIWIDGSTASASEVLASALHDNCRAVTMGDNSFGKGLIQAVYGLNNGAGLVLTVAQYQTPNGNKIQNIGIVPDIKGKVPLPLPGIGSDTSKVDFNEIERRLDPSFCTPPSSSRANMPTTTETTAAASP